MSLDKQALDNKVLTLIVDCTAQSTSSIAPLLTQDFGDQDGTVLENSLKRLKSKEFIAFDKSVKHWIGLSAGRTHLSTLSAPTEDSVVVSGQPTGDAGNKEDQNMKNQNDSESSVADIDEAINKAKSAKKGDKPAKVEGAKRPRLSDEEKAARDKLRAEERATAKAERDRVRAEKKAAKETNRPTAHMSKVQKAAERLPSLETTAQDLFNDATANLDAASIAALAAHLQHFNRTKATERALTQKVGVDDVVKVVSGDARYIGLSGVVTKAQRIRCYVKVSDDKKPIYLFTSDVEVVKAAPVAATGS